MDEDYVSLIAVLLVLLLPATVVLTIFSVLRMRRGKFRRQRITKGSSSRSE